MLGFEHCPHAALADLVQDHVVAQVQALALALINLLSLIGRQLVQPNELANQLLRDLWTERTGILSTQVLQELTVNLRRKAAKPLDSTATREVVVDYLTWQVVVNMAESVMSALE